MKVAKEDALNAARLLAMLSGETSEKVEYDSEEANTTVESATKKSTKASKAGSAAKGKLGIYSIPIKEEYKELKLNNKVTVVFPGHDIKYKEALWGVDSVSRDYEFEIVTNSSRAKLIADRFIKKNKSDRDTELAKAENGDTRYIRLVYFGAVPVQAAELVWLKLEIENDEVTIDIDFNKAAVDTYHLDDTQIWRDIKKVLTEELE